MGRLNTPPPDALTPGTMIGCKGNIYKVPDLASVDRHVKYLTDRLRHWERSEKSFAELVETLRTDRDALLDYRNLMVVVEPV